MWMKLFFVVLLALILGSAHFADNMYNVSADTQNRGAHAGVFLCTLFAVFLAFGLGFYANRLRGKLITIDQLKRGVWYTIYGNPASAWFPVKGFFTTIIFVTRGFNDPDCNILALKLPVALPDNASGLMVFKNYHPLRGRVFGTRALLVQADGKEMTIVVPLKPAKANAEEKGKTARADA